MIRGRGRGRGRGGYAAASYAPYPVHEKPFSIDNRTKKILVEATAPTKTDAVRDQFKVSIITYIRNIRCLEWLKRLML